MEHRTPTDRQRALAWLAERLRWERTLEALRTDRCGAPEHEELQARVNGPGPVPRSIDPRSRPPGRGSIASGSYPARENNVLHLLEHHPDGLADPDRRPARIH